MNKLKLKLKKKNAKSLTLFGQFGVELVLEVFVEERIVRSDEQVDRLLHRFDALLELFSKLVLFQAFTAVHVRLRDSCAPLAGKATASEQTAVFDDVIVPAQATSDFQQYAFLMI